jgi:hypothetical protein
LSHQSFVISIAVHHPNLSRVVLSISHHGSVILDEPPSLAERHWKKELNGSVQPCLGSGVAIDVSVPGSIRHRKTENIPGSKADTCRSQSSEIFVLLLGMRETPS